MFKWDILEALTRTQWYVVPLVWGPIATFLGVLSVLQFTDRYVVTFRSFVYLPLLSIAPNMVYTSEG